MKQRIRLWEREWVKESLCTKLEGNSAEAEALTMCARLNIWLASKSKYAKAPYHSDQVALYFKFTELTFKALNLPSVSQFTEKLAESLGIKKVDVRILRMPSPRSRFELEEKEGKAHIVIEELRGRSWRTNISIDIYPDLLWPIKDKRPFGSIGIRGYILNTSIRALIHEMLHQSGVHDEAEAKRLGDQHYKEFRRTHLSRFEEEFKPILKEWKKTEKEMGL